MYHSLLFCQNLFHRRTRSYSCGICGARFSSPTILRHHMSTQPHHKFCCQECGKSYAQKEHYLSHVLSHGLRCTICNQSFYTAAAAHHHYRTTHLQNLTNTNGATLNSGDITESLSQCTRTGSQYEPADEDECHETQLLSTRDRTEQEERDIKCRGYNIQETKLMSTNGRITVEREEFNINPEGEHEEENVVIILSCKGDGEVVQLPQQIQDDDSYVLEIDLGRYKIET